MNARTKDQLNYVGKLSVWRVFNMVLIYFSYHLSRFLKKPILWGRPVAISIEPTTSCNLGCPECPSGLKKFSRPTGNLEVDFFQDTLLQLKSSLTYCTFYFQGEPFINPSFLKMVEFASKHSIYTSTSTNAHFLRDEVAKRTVESGLDRIIISIDGTTQETYEQYRKNGTLEKVIEGTKNLIKWKKELKSATPYVIFQFLVVSHNEHQTDDVLKLGDELGVDEVRFKTAQLYDYENGNSLMPQNEKYRRYRKLKNGKYIIKNKLLNQCWRMWQGFVITWDGLVVPCCFDKDATHQLGDLKENTAKNVWKSAEYQGFRQAILKSRGDIDICKNCTEGTKVWVGQDQ